MRKTPGLLLLTLTFSCGDSNRLSELADFKDIKRADLRSDGLYNVVCMDDSFEIGVTREQILNDQVCKPTAQPALDRSQLLLDLGNVLSDKASTFEASTRRLAEATGRYCETMGSKELQIVQDEVRFAASQWAMVEFLQVGPLADNAGALKTNIQSWPYLSNLCKIESEAMYALEEGDAYEISVFTNRKTLNAIEFLAFRTDLKSSCTSVSPDYQKWQQLSDSDKRRAQCLYLKVITKDLAAQASVLKESWGPKNGHLFTRHAANPEKIQAMTQALFENLFYVDSGLRKTKLRLQEYSSAATSQEALQNNIKAFSSIMQDDGFDDLLRSEGGKDAEVPVQRMEKNLAELLKTSYEPAAVSNGHSEFCSAEDTSWFCRMDRLLTQITHDLQSEYAKILQLQVPKAPAGDND